jgi:hypothetical protein
LRSQLSCELHQFAVALLLAACNQKTETRTTTDSTGTVQTQTTTITATVPAIDTAEIVDAKDAVNDAAHATGTALEKAGKDIQKKTKKH